MFGLNRRAQAGMPCNESAWLYGPIKVTASADDTPSAVKVFAFNYETDQMLFDVEVLQMKGSRVGLWSATRAAIPNTAIASLGYNLTRQCAEMMPVPSSLNYKTQQNCFDLKLGIVGARKSLVSSLPKEFQ